MNWSCRHRKSAAASDGTHEYEGVVVAVSGSVVTLTDITHTTVPNPQHPKGKTEVTHRGTLQIRFDLSDTDNVIWQDA